MKKVLFAVLILIPLLVVASPQGVPAHTRFTCGTSSLKMLAQNNSRGYLIMQNQGTANCYLKAGSAIVSPEGLIVQTMQNYETVEAFTKQPWYCLCDSAGQVMSILETNY